MTEFRRGDRWCHGKEFCLRSPVEKVLVTRPKRGCALGSVGRRGPRPLPASPCPPDSGILEWERARAFPVLPGRPTEACEAPAGRSDCRQPCAALEEGLPFPLALTPTGLMCKTWTQPCRPVNSEVYFRGELSTQGWAQTLLCELCMTRGRKRTRRVGAGPPFSLCVMARGQRGGWGGGWP